MIIILLSALISNFSALAQDRVTTLDGQQVFIPKLGSKEQLSSHPRFAGFIQQMFNRQGDFFGPNCYNTSLIASGLFTSEKKRYVSPEEFEALLANNFSKVSTPQYKDLIVFDANSSRGHAAFYLGDNLIFHKKSFGTQYHYRITDVKMAGVVEENEWTPGPMDDSDQMKWPELGNLPKEYYRIKSSTYPRLDSKIGPLISKIEAYLLADLKNWGIGKKWGMTGESLLEDLLSYSKKIKADKYTEGVITSLKDQIFIMIDEIHFKRARNASRVMEELCIPEQKDQLFSLIRELGKILSKDEQKIEAVLKKLQEQDRSRCRLRPLDELLQ